jgi:oligosaccharyltransferase complex subunit epsilon
MAPKTTQPTPQSQPLISSEWSEVFTTLGHNYSKNTPKKLKLLDFFIIFSLFLALLQFFYALFSGSFPYNSFLAGLFCAVGFAVLCVALRLQAANPKDFGNITTESAFFGFVVGNLALFIIVTTFMG